MKQMTESDTEATRAALMAEVDAEQAMTALHIELGAMKEKLRRYEDAAQYVAPERGPWPSTATQLVHMTMKREEAEEKLFTALARIADLEADAVEHTRFVLTTALKLAVQGRRIVELEALGSAVTNRGHVEPPVLLASDWSEDNDE